MVVKLLLVEVNIVKNALAGMTSLRIYVAMVNQQPYNFRQTSVIRNPDSRTNVSVSCFLSSLNS
jgi:hypothetical protein